MTTYTNWNEGFGDTFATVNLMLRKAHHHRMMHLPKPRLSRRQHGRDLGPMHDSIRSLLSYPTDFDSVDEPGDTSLSGYDVWACEFYPTLTRWNSSAQHLHATYQFDGVSSPEKNPPLEDQTAILNAVDMPAYRLGKHLGDRKCVELLLGSALFVGCDSGLSHLAHSVGTPMFLLEYQLPVVTCHRGKAYIRCEGAQDFAIKLGRWIDYRRFIGAGL